MNYVIGHLVITPGMFFVIYLVLVFGGLTAIGLYVRYLIRQSRKKSGRLNE